MNKPLQNAVLCFAGVALPAAAAIAQTMGPSTTTTPYLVPMAPGVAITSILTTGDSVGAYKMAGIPDGLGAFDNGDSTFTLVMNHEHGNAVGVTRAHGSNGAFVSKWVIKKSNLQVMSGQDLMQTVYLWNTLTNSYVAYNSAYPSTSAAFNRFCSADLPAVTAFFNPATGKGTQQRIFMNGEEAGSEGRAMAHIVTGPNAGKSYELPYLGKFSWENSVASPTASDTTVVIGMDDATPGQVYVYVGVKSNTGNEIERAGLSGGRLYGISVAGLATESSGGVPTPGTNFSLADLGDVHNMTGTQLNTNSNTVGVTNFLRPEDGAWDPAHPNDFYFATTNSITAPSRLWKLHFNNPANPTMGGTITAVLDGTEGQKMLDNLTIDNYGHILLVEDVGGNAHLGKTWQYTIATDALVEIASHDTTRFLTGGSNFLTIDEEASGILDVESILGPGKFLVVDQAHYTIPGALVEGGQLLSLFNPDTYNAAPEISVSGSSINITSGDNTPSIADNTDFGASNVGTAVTKTFTIHNSGVASLSVSGVSFMGPNASDFTVTGATFPMTVATGSSATFTVQFTPSANGPRNAMLRIANTDGDEGNFTFAVTGAGVEAEISVTGNGADIIDGDLTAGTATNTDFGTVAVGANAARSFVIRNTGTGALAVTSITFSGANASEFSVTGITFPVSVAAGSTYTVNASFAPTAEGMRNATMNITSNDVDEATFNYAVQGRGLVTTGVAAIAGHKGFNLYPNPTGSNASLSFELTQDAAISAAIVDMQGREVMTIADKTMKAGQQTININTTNLANGVYFVKVSNGSTSANVKLIVIH